jgi:hypothetical protein
MGAAQTSPHVCFTFSMVTRRLYDLKLILLSHILSRSLAVISGQRLLFRTSHTAAVLFCFILSDG